MGDMNPKKLAKVKVLKRTDNPGSINAYKKGGRTRGGKR